MGRTASRIARQRQKNEKQRERRRWKRMMKEE